ncbi:hypothetical protein LOD99_12266 [Oopsacas minuta]|uniref:Ubiquitin-protein ligase E3A N-terminal zinc-binding domain-containing protein n=1 Tax=Oopsacas minuta TaxID=111878 RepID=A0AAV7JFR4_9METZ|nr:hypothetical protein LOD99_12266 [Oopsacas minuta]
MDITSVTNDAVSSNDKVLKDETKRKSATKLQIQNYFIMLTQGCGDHLCTNSNCVTANPDSKLSPNEAAIKSITLFKAKSPLCQKYKTAGRVRAGGLKNRVNHPRVMQETPIDMEIDGRSTNSLPTNSTASQNDPFVSNTFKKFANWATQPPFIEHRFVEIPE